ncbi:glycoside hydrolase family 15 protein [Boletus edulis BED1]|uniref:glucan 1,4-alpha-glucosidase n=1 Tax=Boletus edulis BED1 TaxID=1328754 RepID=A0AAD4GG58_BOLED|nr:glycoside hydrolase family 15 protein [Boletus edulis BED1]
MRRFLLTLLAVKAVCSPVDTYIATESPIAKAGLLANIGSSGSLSSGAYPGIVIASPSTTNPNYLYTWVRDSSLVFKTLIDQYTLGQDTSLRSLIDSFVQAEATIQQVTNPSGTVSTGGLGEPKFYINETAYEEPWGRPQRDGPALRSTAIITYANWLIADGNTSHVTGALWPVLRLDLDYVANNWNQTTFDLWEELDSSSFFTTASYWTPSPGFMTANTGGGRSGIDINTVLASIHTFDVNAGCDDTTFQPCSDKALSNLKTYVDSFRNIYSVNSGIIANAAVATGRYQEDVYQGGNPWYLATFAVAEQLYDALIVWNKQGSLTITSTSLGFFQQFNTSLTIGTCTASSSTFTSLMSGIKNFADGFIAVGAQYTPSSGSLSEQYSRSNGSPLSAIDLTWNYASALTAFAARAGQTSASWGANGLTVCIEFNVNATTVLGENIYLTGSVSALTNWGTSNPILLSSDSYPIWSTTVNLPAKTEIQYKYIRIHNEQVTWESDPNNKFATEASGAQTLNDVWRYSRLPPNTFPSGEAQEYVLSRNMCYQGDCIVNQGGL